MRKRVSPTVQENFRIRPFISIRLARHAERVGKPKAHIVSVAILQYLRRNRKR